MVNVIYDGRKIVACRSRDDNLLRACCDVSRSLLFGGVEAGALQNYVNTNLSPRKVLCICLFIDGDFLTINDDAGFGSFYSVLALAELAGEAALCGIILQKVS